MKFMRRVCRQKREVGNETLYPTQQNLLAPVLPDETRQEWLGGIRARGCHDEEAIRTFQDLAHRVGCLPEHCGMSLRDALDHISCRISNGSFY
ncbi:MAG: hypothetical protein P8J43_08985, partial [Pirellulales bacterium]|nr:hypothetical protein [Pirellulales bacterium]